MRSPNKNMLTLLSDNLWSQIQTRSKRRGNSLAAVAYVSSDDIIRFGDGDTLVVDASDAAIGTGQTAARVLRSAYDRGAKVVNLPGLHAKVLVLGGSAIVGSANLSLNSRKLFEAGVVSSEPQLVAGVIQLIVALAARGTAVTEAFLNRIERIPVTKRAFGGKRRPGAPIRLRRNRAWILGIAEVRNILAPSARLTQYRRVLQSANRPKANRTGSGGQGKTVSLGSPLRVTT